MKRHNEKLLDYHITTNTQQQRAITISSTSHHSSCCKSIKGCNYKLKGVRIDQTLHQLLVDIGHVNLDHGPMTHLAVTIKFQPQHSKGVTTDWVIAIFLTLSPCPSYPSPLLLTNQLLHYQLNAKVLPCFGDLSTLDLAIVEIFQKQKFEFI